jgi:hypothetical protein
MAIDPVKIPQNVYIEDRIVGPLTLRQTLIMALGCGFSYMLYTSIGKAMGGRPDPITTVLVCIPGLISIAFSLIKVNDLSLSRIMLLMVERSNKPVRRTWTPRRGLTIHIRTLTQELEKAEKEKEDQHKKAEAEAHTESKLSELTTVLDQPLKAKAEAIDQLKAPAPEKSMEEEQREKAPTFPVDPGRISVDQPQGTVKEDDDGLSAYRGVFRDIHPNNP